MCFPSPALPGSGSTGLLRSPAKLSAFSPKRKAPHHKEKLRPVPWTVKCASFIAPQKSLFLVEQRQFGGLFQSLQNNDRIGAAHARHVANHAEHIRQRFGIGHSQL